MMNKSQPQGQSLLAGTDPEVFFSEKMKVDDLDDVDEDLNDDKMKTEFDEFPESVALSFFLDTISALNYLHSNEVKICHRDIKPQNLLIDRNGVVKLGDFGRALKFEEDNDYQVKGTEGTYTFFAPEMCSTEEKTDESTGSPTITPFEIFANKHDIWSLGITLYCWLYGRCPYWGCGLLGLFDEIAKADGKKLIFPDDRDKGLLYDSNTGEIMDEDDVNNSIKKKDSVDPGDEGIPRLAGLDPEDVELIPDKKKYQSVSAIGKNVIRGILVKDPRKRPNAGEVLEMEEVKKWVSSNGKDSLHGEVVEFFKKCSKGLENVDGVGGDSKRVGS